MFAYNNDFIIKSAVPIAQILKYFDEIGVQKNSGGYYTFNSLEITIKEDYNPVFSNLLIPQNTIIIEGTREECILFVDKFRLKFLSAGG